MPCLSTVSAIRQSSPPHSLHFQGIDWPAFLVCLQWIQVLHPYKAFLTSCGPPRPQLSGYFVPGHEELQLWRRSADMSAPLRRPCGLWLLLCAELPLKEGAVFSYNVQKVEEQCPVPVHVLVVHRVNVYQWIRENATSHVLVYSMHMWMDVEYVMDFMVQSPFSVLTLLCKVFPEKAWWIAKQIVTWRVSIHLMKTRSTWLTL